MIHRQENGLRNPFEYNVNNDQEDRLGGHLPVCLFGWLFAHVLCRFLITHTTHRHILMIIIIIIIISLQRYDTHTTAIIIMLMNNDR